MFGLTKKAEKSMTALRSAVETMSPKKGNPFIGRTQHEIIEEIHATFYSEVDRLLEDAKIAGSLETDKANLISKAERLTKLGFSSSREVVDAQSEIIRLEKIKWENEQKRSLIESINHYTLRYPFYKFITEDAVKRICKKYGLIYGKISIYKGCVPEKNLSQIEKFQVDESDSAYEAHRYDRTSWDGRVHVSYLSLEYAKKLGFNKGSKLARISDHMGHSDVFQSPLEIVAPSTDFDLTKMQIKNFEIVAAPIPDPIVLKPVMFGSIKHYLIITAWGLEAQDEEVFNQIQN